MSTEVILGVGGMTCNACVNNVKNALNQVSGVSNVIVDLESSQATIDVDEAGPNKKELEAVVTNAGYSIHEPGTDFLQLSSTPKKVDFNWSDRGVWLQSAHNTKWCLVGCSIGDFGTIAFFQFVLTDVGWPTLNIMLLAMFNGLMTSIALETFILTKQMALAEAFRTACGMSLISMISMEAAMNIVDVMITGGAMLAWYTLPPMLLAGFLTPWPYNYWRLKKYDKSCC